VGFSAGADLFRVVKRVSLAPLLKEEENGVEAGPEGEGNGLFAVLRVLRKSWMVIRKLRLRHHLPRFFRKDAKFCSTLALGIQPAKARHLPQRITGAICLIVALLQDGTMSPIAHL